MEHHTGSMSKIVTVMVMHLSERPGRVNAETDWQTLMNSVSQLVDSPILCYKCSW